MSTDPVHYRTQPDWVALAIRKRIKVPIKVNEFSDGHFARQYAESDSTHWAVPFDLLSKDGHCDLSNAAEDGWWWDSEDVTAETTHVAVPIAQYRLLFGVEP